MMPGTMSMSSLKKLEDIKTAIRALLISEGSRDVTLPKLSKIYKEEMDQDIPYKDFCYTSLKDFLNSMPDVLHLRHNNKDQLCAYHIDTERTKHISSLVARQKTHSKSDKSRSNHRQQNLIDPCILKTVLQDLTKSSPNINLGISKTAVLSKITSDLGRGTLYNIDDLNRQLVELSHLLINDDNYIYYKNNSTNSKQKSRELNIQKNNALNLQNINIENSMFSNSVGDLVKESTKKRLQNLIEKHADGIWCYELPTLYVKEYGLDLEYIDLGFSCIIEFVGALPNIFKIIKEPNNKKVKVIDARNNEISLTNTKNNLTFDLNNGLTKNETNETKAIPIKNLSPIVSKRIIPVDFMSIDDTIDHIRVTSLCENTKKFIDVVVSEVFSPTKFWVILRKNKKKRKKIMSLLQEFYNLQNIEKYEVPPIVTQKGLHIACTFDDKWHRGMIKKVKSDEVDVYFYDYGTTYSYKPNQLYFLNKQFSIVPAQAIPCSLYNVTPIGKDKWSIAVVKQFVEKVMEKSFIASIVDVKEENNFMNINLIDADGVYINEWMVANKLALFGTFRCIPSNIAFKQYLECTKKKDLLDAECTVNIISENISSNSISNESNHLSPNVMSSQKKLEALKRYQKRLSTSLQSSSSGVCLNNESIGKEPSPTKDICSSYEIVLSKEMLHTNNSNSEKNKNLNCKIQPSSHANFNNDSADNEKQIGLYSKNNCSLPFFLSFASLDNDSNNDENKYNDSICSINEKLIDRCISNSNNENGTNNKGLYSKYSIKNFSTSSLYPSSLSNDSLKSESFSSYTDSSSEKNTCNSLMFKGCSEPVIIGVTNSKSSKTRVSSKKNRNSNNPLTELQKLMSSTKL